MMQTWRCLFVSIVIILVVNILAKIIVVQNMAGMDIEELKDWEVKKMIEQAFIVNKGSKLYQEYFETLAEKQKMHDFARVFFKKHDLLDENLGYRMTEALVMQLTPEQREKYATQLKKLIDKDEMCYFKKASPMYQEWLREVASKVDFNVMEQLWCWYWPYISQGAYALWDSGDILYGYLMDKNKEKIDLADYMMPIKMSEYYLAKETRSD